MRITTGDMELEGCLGLLADYAKLQDSDPTEVDGVIVDLSSIQFARPFGLLLMSATINRLKTILDLECSVIPLRGKVHSYAQHMGFYRAFGEEAGKYPGEAPGSITYLPLTLLDPDAIRAQASAEMKLVQTVIESDAERMAATIAQGAVPDLRSTVSFCIREVLRNVLEHAEALTLGYAAQYWPASDLVEVAVVDTGIGIPSGLSSNPFQSDLDDETALLRATMPGISGKAFRGVKRDPYDHWQNSGFGLWMIRHLCEQTGSLVLISNGAYLEFDGSRVSTGPTQFKGTAVRIRLHPSKLEPYSVWVPRSAAKGEEEAKGLEGAVNEASSASKR